MSNLTISINSETLLGLDTSAFARGNGSANGREVMQQLARYIAAAAAGTMQSPSVHVNWSDTVALGDDAVVGPAGALLVLSGGSGPVGGTIAGTLVTATWATSDTAAATLIASTVNANTTVNRFINATNVLAQMTLASVTAGQTVNVGGITFTAVATAADVVRFGQFNINGADTADATALVLAINRHPALSGRFRAISNAAVVYIAPVDRLRSLSPFETIGGAPSTITVNRAVPTAGAQVAILANIPGAIGNEIRLTASGTGVTAATNGTAGFLGNGTGGSRATTRMVVLP